MPLVLFNEVLDHVLRIDRIFRQPQVSSVLSFWGNKVSRAHILPNF